MKFLTKKYSASVVNGEVSSISLSEAIDEPRIWNTTKVICPFLTASRKPISRKACSVGDINPARTSTTVTVASVGALVKFAGGHDPGPLALPPPADDDDDQSGPWKLCDSQR